MQCSGCGKSLTDGVSVCLHCGTPIPGEGLPRSIAIAAEPRPDPVPFSGDNWPVIGVATSPYGREYSSFSPPPPPMALAVTFPETSYPILSSKPHWLPRRLLLATFVVLALTVGIVGAYRLVSAKTTTIATTTTQTDGALSRIPTPLDQQRCAPASLDESSASVINGVQLTSGLRDQQAGDYTPVDTVAAFQVGKAAYLTFTVGNLTSNGTLIATWCLGTSNLTTYKAILITTKEAGVRGYFSVSNIDRHAVGPSRAVIWWRPADANGSARDVAIYTILFHITDPNNAH